MVVIGWKIDWLKSGYFIYQFVRFMDQDWHTLWADIEFLGLELESQQRSVLFRDVAINAG
jgi:hypothetical protein